MFSYMLTFILGALFGGTLGVILTAIVVAGYDGRDE